MTTTRIRPCGQAALLVECADLAEAVATAARAEQMLPDAVDVVAAARTVLVTVGDPAALPGLRRRLEDLLTDSPPARNPLPGGAAADLGEPAGVVTIDVRYDGPDLADVADLAGMSTEALVRTHTSITWRAAFGGFAPGFSYLVDERDLAGERQLAGERVPGSGGLPVVPRLDSPRPRVDAGSVGLADRFCAVYPGASPGGWRLIGRTDARMWDLDRDRPALLSPGTRVTFRARDGSR